MYATYELLSQTFIMLLIFAFSNFYSEAAYPFLSCVLDMSDYFFSIVAIELFHYFALYISHSMYQIDFCCF